MAVPPIPSGVSLQDNIALANNRRMHLKPGSAFAYSWFYSQVRGVALGITNRKAVSTRRSVTSTTALPALCWVFRRVCC